MLVLGFFLVVLVVAQDWEKFHQVPRKAFFGRMGGNVTPPSPAPIAVAAGSHRGGGVSLTFGDLPSAQSPLMKRMALGGKMLSKNMFFLKIAPTHANLNQTNHQ